MIQLAWPVISFSCASELVLYGGRLLELYASASCHLSILLLYTKYIVGVYVINFSLPLLQHEEDTVKNTNMQNR